MSNPYTAFNDGIIDEFRTNDGTVSRFGRDLVLLHHVGAKTGTERIAPLRAIRTGPDTWTIAASKAGAPDHPAWFHNLLAHPDTRIETPDDGVVPVRAVVLEGAERDAAWSEFTAASAAFGEYAERTSRVIPVVALTRRG
jgi:deazaflavin-dependent oxidoreductase (nitroreductase family)